MWRGSNVWYRCCNNNTFSYWPTPNLAVSGKRGTDFSNFEKIPIRRVTHTIVPKLNASITHRWQLVVLYTRLFFRKSITISVNSRKYFIFTAGSNRDAFVEQVSNRITVWYTSSICIRQRKVSKRTYIYVCIHLFSRAGKLSWGSVWYFLLHREQ